MFNNKINNIQNLRSQDTYKIFFLRSLLTTIKFSNHPYHITIPYNHTLNSSQSISHHTQIPVIKYLNPTRIPIHHNSLSFKHNPVVLLFLVSVSSPVSQP